MAIQRDGAIELEREHHIGRVHEDAGCRDKLGGHARWKATPEPVPVNGDAFLVPVKHERLRAPWLEVDQFPQRYGGTGREAEPSEEMVLHHVGNIEFRLDAVDDPSRALEAGVDLDEVETTVMDEGIDSEHTDVALAMEPPAHCRRTDLKVIDQRRVKLFHRAKVVAAKAEPGPCAMRQSNELD